MYHFFIHQCSLRLLPHLGYYEHCCYKHRGVYTLFSWVFLLSSDKYPGAELPYCVVVLFLIFEESPNCFPVNLEFYILPTVHEGFVFSLSSPPLVTYCVFDNRFEVTSHCGFNLHFPEDSWCWASFYAPVGHLYALYEEISIQVLCTFLNWIVFWMMSCMSSLYILNIHPLSDISFSDIFFHSVGGLFILSIVSFMLQELFSLM